MHETPKPFESPSIYADRLGEIYTSQVSVEHKKLLGQFFTPLRVAVFMAKFCTVSKNKIRILDPGCGLGVLSCTLIEDIVAKHPEVRQLDLVAFETDSYLINHTESVLEYLSDWLKNKKVQFSYFLCKNDFILHNTEILNGANTTQEKYDLIISNPPYFKLKKNDLRTLAAKSIIYGQTNIYTIFLVIAAKLLDPGGQLIFITPRSFSSGSYFRAFREKFFSEINIINIHVFESRKEAFVRDKILQENIIVVGKRKDFSLVNQLKFPFLSGGNDEVKISFSKGVDDIGTINGKNFKFGELVNWGSPQKILHIPLTERDEKAIGLFKTWRNTLRDYQMEISTGPVVDFRSTDFISDTFKRDCVPLIYLHNVDKMKFSWPLKKNVKGKKKGHFIIHNDNSRSRLVENKDYVLIRRFSSKEDHSRLVATGYFAEEFKKYEKIGIENHLNYVYRPLGFLRKEEVVGLSAILNSKLFDIYFRTFNGNINVSSTELRDLPLPPLEIISEIGEKVLLCKDFSEDFINAILFDIFKIDLKYE